MIAEGTTFEFGWQTLVWQSAALLCAGLAATWLLRRWPARAHMALTLCCALCFVMPVLTLAVRSMGGGILPAEASMEDAASATGGSAPLAADIEAREDGADAVAMESIGHGDTALEGASADADFVSPAPATPAFWTRVENTWTTLDLHLPRRMLGIGWAMMGALLLAGLLTAAWRGRRLLGCAVPCDDAGIDQQLRAAARRIDIAVKPHALVSTRVGSPAIWCWSNEPKLLLPASAFGGRSATVRHVQLDWTSLFCHELAHWKRRDHIAALVADLLVCLIPWNPLAWWARKRLSFLAERACDDAVLAAGRSPADYADSLLSFVTARPSGLALAAVSTRTNLARRIQAILTERPIRPGIGRLWLTLSAAIAFGVAFAGALAQPAVREAGRTPDLSSNSAPPAAMPSLEDDSKTQTMTERLANLQNADWREAFAVGEKLAALPADEGYTVLSNAWPGLNVQAKQQILKAWHFAAPYPLHARMHPRALDVMNLGMTDTSPSVQSWSITFLKQVAFRDFAEDIQAYRNWYQANQPRPIADVMHDACTEYAKAFANATGLERVALAHVDVGWVFRDVPELRAVAADQGLLNSFASWMRDPTLEQDVERCMGQLLPQLDPPQDYLQSVVLPAATNGATLGIREMALRTLAKPENKWAVEPVIDVLKEAAAGDSETRGSLLWSAAQALAAMDDPRPIPVMIDLIAADNSYDTVYGVGYFGLGKLTGVQYDESHDGAWWSQWWEKNRGRYPQVADSVPGERPVGQRSQPVPEPLATAGLSQNSEPEADDVADVPSKDIKIGKGDKQRYFLIGPAKGKKAPKDGYKLLLVLPGGDGSADFNPFVKRIWKNALPDGYIVAQPVAPKWRDDENRIVWPTKGSPDDKARFTTEQFIAAIIKDVAKHHAIDKKHVSALAWSSSGPAIYATAMMKESPLTGAFIAMSVYKPQQLPPASNAKGRAFYLLHSPQDFIKMTFPESAEKDLSKAGAKVKLETYEGGHGWKGDVFGMIRTGVDWLEKQQK